MAGLIADAAGDLFGTTSGAGGDSVGNVFEMAKTAGGYSWFPLVTFGGADGATPDGGLIADAAGDLFGTTSAGGAGGNGGTVFEAKPNGSSFGSSYTLTTLASFSTSQHGNKENPTGALLADAAGDLFGTTQFGGAFDAGTVFELEPNGSGYTLTTLYSFSGGADGLEPESGVSADARGDLFGTTSAGGAFGDGTVFEIATGPAGYSFFPLFSFNGADGSVPESGLIVDAAGDVFGTTSGEGLNTDSPAGVGTVFELAKGALTTLLTFGDGMPQQRPHAAALIADARGDLFGTTYGAGASQDGAVFEVSGTGFQRVAITGTEAGQTTTSEAPVTPFSSVTIGDVNAGATDTLTITVGGTGGTLSGTDLSGGAGGVYTLSGTAAAITGELDALSFTPTAGPAHMTSMSTFTLSDQSSAPGADAAVDAITTVIDGGLAVAPTIYGTKAGQTTTSEAPVMPFSGVTIADINAGATDRLFITVGGTGGTLRGTGLIPGPGSYLLSGTAAAVTSELDALSFTPKAGPAATSTFTLSDKSSAYATATVDTTTTVTDNPAASVASAANSSIVASPGSVTADGTSTTTLTVTVEDAQRQCSFRHRGHALGQRFWQYVCAYIRDHQCERCVHGHAGVHDRSDRDPHGDRRAARRKRRQ